MKIETLEVAGFQPALYGMRNPFKSHKLSDTWQGGFTDGFYIGEKDLALAKKLIQSGTEHAKFTRQIQVWANFTMPRYWWQEFDQYHFHVTNSESTMHKLFDKDREIQLSDFQVKEDDILILQMIVNRLNKMRHEFFIEKALGNTDEMNKLLIRAKRILPESYLQMRTVNLSYAEIFNMYSQRKNHRLKEEWQDTFCRWAETLPYFKELYTE